MTHLAPFIQHDEQRDEDLPATKRFLSELEEFGVTINDDLTLFHDLITATEKRTPTWQQRSYYLCKLALELNQTAGTPTTPNQLTAAVLMHDFAMTFTPIAILHKKKALNSGEKRIVAAHVRYSYDFLNRLGWEAAAEMVIQHHERSDGTGYPKGLREIEICDGAKILAIADAFYACTAGITNHRHNRKIGSSTKGKLMHAVLEINRNCGNQFSPKWVEVFNEAVNKKNFRNFSCNYVL